MSREDIKYAFTIIGGGWSYIHDLYIITQDDKIYHTEKFSEDDLLNCELEFVCSLYEDIGNPCVSSTYSFDGSTVKRKYLKDLMPKDGKVNFEDFKEREYIVMDAPDVTLYKTENGVLRKLIRQSDDSESIPAVQYVKVLASLHNMMNRDKLQARDILSKIIN